MIKFQQFEENCHSFNTKVVDQLSHNIVHTTPVVMMKGYTVM